MTRKAEHHVTVQAILGFAVLCAWLTLMCGWCGFVCWLIAKHFHPTRFIDWIGLDRVSLWMSKAGIPFTLALYQAFIAWMGSVALLMVMPVIIWIHFNARKSQRTQRRAISNRGYWLKCVVSCYDCLT